MGYWHFESINPGAFSGAKWRSRIGHDILISENPANHSVLGKVSLATQEDYDYILQEAKAASLAWQAWPAPKRGEIIRQMGDILRQHKEALGELVSREMGKSLREGEGEVQEMIDMADFAVGQSRMLYGLSMHSERPAHRLFEQWHPLGVIGVITAFNFPVAVWAWNAFLAAICGNVTIWKPSSKTPLSAIAVHQLCAQVLEKNQAPAIFHLLITDRKVGESLLKETAIPLISFTGSTEVGRHVAQVVGERLGRSLLELGGNNAIIVDETADLDLALRAIVFGAIGTTGQRCTTTRRLFLQRGIYENVMARLVKIYGDINIGDPVEPQSLMGPLVDKTAVMAYQEAIAGIQSEGGRIHFGGQIIDRPGYFVEPTLVTDLSHDSIWVQREIFVPILYIFPFDDFEEAVQRQNAVKQGLSSALFTQNLRHSEYFLSAMGSDCGIANINIGTSGAEIGGAFGGEKETGGGRESGSDAWKVYMRRQTNTVNWGRDLPLAQGINFDL